MHPTPDPTTSARPHAAGRSRVRGRTGTTGSSSHPAGTSARPAGARSRTPDTPTLLTVSRARVDATRALAEITASLVSVRSQIAALHAQEASLLAQADQLADTLAVAEDHPDQGVHEHRAVAAVLAVAVRESDRGMVSRICHARTLTERYPAIHEALRVGRISPSHATVIIDAGTVITDDDLRDRYVRDVLPVAETVTVGRLRPLAREIAERYTVRTLDDRYRDACTRRRVRVVSVGDGMADLTATLPAVYAYGVFDRLTQMGWAVKQADRAAAADAATGTDATATAATAAGAGAGADAAAGGVDDTETTTAHVPHPVRSLDEIRADILTDLLLGSNPNETALGGLTGMKGVRGRVQVIIDQTHLNTPNTPNSSDTADKTADTQATPGPATGSDTGPETKADTSDNHSNGKTTRDDNPNPKEDTTTARPLQPTLTGYGPIPITDATRIAGHTSHWEHITINPHTGHILTVDTYRPNTKLRQFLRARDQHCRFPGCTTPTTRCDIDHTIDAAHGGPTTSTNLAHLCRYHHTLKHHTRWKVTQHDDGTLKWTAPTGTIYTEPAPSTTRFRRTNRTTEGANKSPKQPTDTHPF